VIRGRENARAGIGFRTIRITLRDNLDVFHGALRSVGF
jgi:hypothetical protein